MVERASSAFNEILRPDEVRNLQPINKRGAIVLPLDRVAELPRPELCAASHFEIHPRIAEHLDDLVGRNGAPSLVSTL